MGGEVSEHQEASNVNRHQYSTLMVLCFWLVNTVVGL